MKRFGMERRGATAGLLALAFAFAGVWAGDDAPVVEFGDKGLRIPAGGDAVAVLEWPTFQPAKGTNSLAKLEKTTVADDKRSAELVYAGGATVAATLIDGYKLRYAVVNAPADFVRLRFEINLPGAFRDGRQWRAGNNAFADMPAEQPSKPHLYQGNAADFAFKAADGFRFAINTPAYGWAEFIDMRQWNNNRYRWWGAWPYNANQGGLFFQLRFGDDAENPADGGAKMFRLPGETASAGTAGASGTTAGVGPATMRLGDNGLVFDAGPLGRIGWGWPRLVGRDHKDVARIGEKKKWTAMRMS